MPTSTRLLHDLCSLPTAAVREEAVFEYVMQWASKRDRLKVQRDRYGNRLLLAKGTATRSPRLILVAHTDHPAFVVQRTEPGRIYAEFRGSVMADHVEGAKVRLFSDQPFSARIDEVETGERGRLKGAWISTRKRVEPGTIGMFDVGDARERGDRFSSRACDDLAGCAAALATLDQLHRKPAEASVGVLLTRAEEVGFVGAIAAARDGKLLRKTDRIISIETSSQQAVAQIGKGVVLRVGDATSIFHSGLSYFLAQRAAALAKKRKNFAFQRALMPGGTCEGTVFDAFGHVASAVCVALGNYHNMDRDRKKMGPEFISISDWRAMVDLFIDAARNLHDFSGGHDALQERLTKRFENHKHLFENANAPLLP